MLCNLISGISTELYTLDPAIKEGSGNRFRELLRNFYPWNSDEDKEDNIKVMYDLVRNPLTHSLGILKRRSLPIDIQKSPLVERQIVEIETSEKCPAWVPFAVERNSTEYVVSVWGLYWGVFHMVERLARSNEQMQQAESRFSEFGASL
jgi:hypothetical protein